MSGLGIAHDDLREFLFSAAADDVITDTLEFRHPAFVDENGDPTAVRVCEANEGDDLVATLEAEAPLDADEAVTFKAGRFQARLPEQSGPGLPTADLSVENVSRIMQPHLERAASNPAPIELTYRAYLLSDDSGPAQIMDGLTIKAANANPLRVSAVAGYEDFLGKPFLTTTYNRGDYPGLDR